MAHDLRRQSSSIALFQIMAIISLIMAIIFIIIAIICFQGATDGSPPRGGWATKCTQRGTPDRAFPFVIHSLLCYYS